MTQHITHLSAIFDRNAMPYFPIYGVTTSCNNIKTKLS